MKAIKAILLKVYPHTESSGTSFDVVLCSDGEKVDLGYWDHEKGSWFLYEEHVPWSNRKPWPEVKMWAKIPSAAKFVEPPAVDPELMADIERSIAACEALEAKSDVEIAELLREHVWANLDVFSAESELIETAIERLEVLR